MLTRNSFFFANLSFYIITEKKCFFLALFEIKLVYLKRIKYYLLIKCIAVYEQYIIA
jgi:hypothetical protein